MTAYVTCEHCKTEVPWYYAFYYRNMPMHKALHPYCRRDLIDEESAGATMVAIQIADELNQSLPGL